ncbi:MAG: ferrous iron transport protein A [Oscillospiraceae bacterium]|jgi:ferrous iron transport protein A|nr:ferrous iron transport protein A [Oscillospiraceae bacterium]
MLEITKLSNIKPFKTARVVKVNINGDMRRRFLDIGLIKGEIVKRLYNSPFNDPVAYLIRDNVIAIRKKDSDNILVEVEKDYE